MARWRNRGQGTANSAAVLVLIITALLLAYILTLPPEDREALLSGSGGDSGVGGAGGGSWGGGAQGWGAMLIMDESPGTLQLQAEPQVEHSLPSTTVFTTTNTVAVKEISSLYIKNSLFSREGASITFEANPYAQGYLLSFNVDSASGNLIIMLNDQIIYNNVVTEKSPQPIILPSDLLKEGTNEIVLFVGDVGLRFWAKNDYQLRNVLVSADVLDFSGAQSEQHFTLPENEYGQLEYGQLTFIPECDPRDTGRLIIEANQRLIYSGFADCGVLNRLDVSNELLKPGDNSIVFVSDQGSYLLDRIEFVSYLKEEDYPLYYFNIPLDLYDVLDSGDAELILTMRFADYRAEKRGEVVINGFVQSFGSTEFVYQAAIDPAILLPGPNTLQIIPHIARLDVTEVKIEMV